MKTKQTKNIKKRLSVWIFVVAAILMIPFSAKAPWTGSDFVFASIVLLGCATAYELITKNMQNKIHRIAVAIAVLFLIALVIAWAASGPPYESAHVITK